ncbi:MAG: bifunctional 4-hydroxy-2-oxoglutarate aldolase/2-dehydro-3-deoxy-phosphogluconate aldolase [Actinomycetota bacterium]
MTSVLDRLAAYRLVPVVVLDRVEDAGPLGQALKAGGLPCAEVTFRTAAAEDAIRELSKDADLLVGAGTVVRADQVDVAVAAGAAFIVSPGFSASVVLRCQQVGVPVLPGVATPSEVMVALDAGLDVVKFFPAETLGGVAALRAMSAPFAGMRFVPTGGVSAANLGDYLALGSVLAVGGSWMVAPSMVRAGAFDEVTRLTAEAVSMAQAS